jgi:hypothetical protein
MGLHKWFADSHRAPMREGFKKASLVKWFAA